MKAILALCLLLLAACVHPPFVRPTPHAGEMPVGVPPYSAELSFSAPTHYADDPATPDDEGIAIPSGVALTYNVYQGAQGGEKALVGTITETGTTIDSGLAAGVVCWEVTAIAEGAESARSEEACKRFAAPAPAKVTVTVT